jgi:hypothetical protein
MIVGGVRRGSSIRAAVEWGVVCSTPPDSAFADDTP